MALSSCTRPLACALALLFPSSSCAFDTPLSPESVREAYFLGQRHDESLAHALDQYTKRLPAPSSGPQISSVTFFTPFALLVQSSSEHMSYSAQQAAIDHRSQPELVKILVEIQLTPTYPAVIPTPTGSSKNSGTSFLERPHTFWKDFAVHVSSNRKLLTPVSLSGEPHVACSEDGGTCTLSGATMTLVFPAEAFSSNSASVVVVPPEGDRVSVDFDLSSLR